MKLRPCLIVATLGLATSPALAADHLMRVGEVLLSNGGSTAQQYVEFQDPGNESFPNSPYLLEVFTAAGSSLGTQTITVPGGTSRFLIATAAAATAFAVTPNATLTITLPTNGQACFNRGTAHIHCLGWGTITTAITGTAGTSTGPTPPDGMSLQVFANVYGLASPTPGSPNTAGSVPDGVPDAGVPGDGSMGTPDSATGTPDSGGNPTTPTDDGGCAVGGGGSWFVLAGLALLAAIGRATRRRD